MTKTDYSAIAAILREYAIDNRELQEALADYFEERNSHFNREAFLAEFWEVSML